MIRQYIEKHRCVPKIAKPEARKHCSVKLALKLLTEVKVIVLGGLTTKEIHLFLLILQILANKLDFIKGSFLN